MSSKGWFSLGSTANLVPDTQYFEGDSAFSMFGLTKTQRLYGFAAWRSFVVVRLYTALDPEVTLERVERSHGGVDLEGQRLHGVRTRC